MEHNVQLRSRVRPRGEVTAALILALGVAIERTRGHRAWLAAVPIVFVNFVAFYGQLSYFRAHRQVQPGTVIPVTVSVVMALALESIAVYLAWQAHVARKSHDSALRLRLGAYLVALVIGALNYSHFCGPHWQPDAYAVSFTIASVISPALWGVHSNRESRDDLKAQGLIEDHAVRLGLTRWFWYPLRSAMVQRLAAWAGESRPAAAIGLYEQRKAGRENGPGGPREGYAQENGRNGSGVTVAPAAAVSEPPSVPRNRKREPQPARLVRAARAAELTAAGQHEAEVLARVIESVRAGQPVPSVRELSQSEFGSGDRCQAAYRVLRLARAAMNGAGHDTAGS